MIVEFFEGPKNGLRISFPADRVPPEYTFAVPTMPWVSHINMLPPDYEHVVHTYYLQRALVNGVPTCSFHYV